MVKRYDLLDDGVGSSSEMVIVIGGEFVEYSDYAELEKQMRGIEQASQKLYVTIDELVVEVKKMLEELKRYEH